MREGVEQVVQISLDGDGGASQINGRTDADFPPKAELQKPGRCFNVLGRSTSEGRKSSRVVAER
jgi:hypothetical protein